jgi:hypothetical protein
VGTSWHGDAANLYYATSSDMASHFQAAASILETASAALKRYSAELERLIREGTIATAQADRCLEEVKVAKHRLELAQQAVQDAETGLDLAHQYAAQARTVPPGVNATSALHTAAAWVQSAEESLAGAQADERAAMQALTAAQAELAQWQARGSDILESAQMTGAQVGARLGVQQLTPPVGPHPALYRSAPTASPGKKRRASRGTVDRLTSTGVARFAKRSRLPLPKAQRRWLGVTGSGAEIHGVAEWAFLGIPFVGRFTTGPVRYIPGEGTGPLARTPTLQPRSAPRGTDTAGGNGQGSETMTINPSAGTITTVTHTKSGETIQTITYTKTGETIETITYPGSTARSGSGATVIG